MGEEQDAHGQPIIRAFNWNRVRDSRIDELIGVCRGILADGVLVYEEARFLLDWLRRNEPVRRTEMGTTLEAALISALADDRLGPEEEEDVVTLIYRFIGGTPPSSDDSSNSTSLPIDDPAPEMSFAGRVFCFTGKFNFGQRQKCERTVVELGADVCSTPGLRTSFLVIGEVGSRDWVHSAMGRKIERAIELRQSGTGIKIVCETCWVGALTLLPTLGTTPHTPERIPSSCTEAIGGIAIPPGVDPNVNRPTAAAAASGGLPLAGQTVVVTGTMVRLQRDEIERLILRLGGKASGSVSKRTSFVVAGDKAGSKLDKARELGIPVLTEAEFIDKIGEENVKAGAGLNDERRGAR